MTIIVFKNKNCVFSFSESQNLVLALAHGRYSVNVTWINDSNWNLAMMIPPIFFKSTPKLIFSFAFYLGSARNSAWPLGRDCFPSRMRNWHAKVFIFLSPCPFFPLFSSLSEWQRPSTVSMQDLGLCTFWGQQTQKSWIKQLADSK